MIKEKYDKVKYNNQFNKNNYDRLAVFTPKGTRDNLKKYCAEHGTTINGLINDYLKSLGVRAE